MVEIFLGRCPGHYLISRFTNCDSISISWITQLIFTYKSLAKDGCKIILIDMETLNATSLFEFFHQYSSCQHDNTCFTLYVHAHENRKLFVKCWIFCKLLYNCKSFPQITRSCNCETFPPQTTCVIQYVPTTEYRYDKKH